MTDFEIEQLFIKHHGTWDGSFWIIEDADLFPFVRDSLSKTVTFIQGYVDIPTHQAINKRKALTDSQLICAMQEEIHSLRHFISELKRLSK